MHNIKLPKIFRPFQCQTLQRLGKNNDGGYLVNVQDVLASNLLLSLGIGPDISFEKNFTFLNNCELNAYDEKIEVDKNFFVDKKKYFEKYVDENNIQDILNTDNNIFLKCDIDGNEYKILDKLINNSYRFTGMIIEFHEITHDFNFDLLTEFISKIKQKLIHIHVNNYFYYKTDTTNIPDTIELTFSSSKNILFNPDIVLPHLLDMPNNPDDFDFKITF